MESERFDELVRTFGQTTTRRKILRGLAGVLAVGAVARGGQEAAAGKTRIGGSPCTKDRQCKTGKCVGEPGQQVCSCSKKKPACLQPAKPCRIATCDVSSNQCETTDAGGDCCIPFAAPCEVLGPDTCCQTENYVFQCLDTADGRICTGTGPR